MHIRAGLLVAVLCFGSTTMVWAQATRAFKDGREAIEAGKWSEATRLLRSAIDQDPEARRKSFSRYTPYYYLGVALSEQGNCPEALAAFGSSERYGALKEGGEERADMARRKSRCEALLTEVEAGVTAAAAAIEQAERSQSSLERLSRHEVLAPRWNEGAPSFASRHKDGLARLAEARSQKRAGAEQQNVEALRASVELAGQAQVIFEGVTKDSRDTLGEVSESVKAASDELDKALQGARNLLGSTRSIQPHPPKLSAQVAKLERTLRSIDEQRDEASAEETQTLIEGLEREMRTLRPLARKPNKALMDAAEAFLAQDFRAVVEGLSEANLRGNRANFHARMLRSAALFSLYVHGGEQDPTLFEECQRLIEENADASADLGQPGEQFFSPRFSQMYLETLDAFRRSDETEALAGEDAGETASSP